jgi:hypothetical protein
MMKGDLANDIANQQTQQQNEAEAAEFKGTPYAPPATPPQPEGPADFTNPELTKTEPFQSTSPDLQPSTERKMNYVGPYNEGTYNYLGLQEDMGNLPKGTIYQAQDAFDQVYGEKPGFVATEDPDGGFLEWARNVVDPEELRKQRKENRMRKGIIALGDALRHFGNIYHTTKGAPSQTLTNATEKEYLRQKQEEQVAYERLLKQYESEMKRLDTAYERAIEQQKLEEARELQKEKLQLQKDNYDLRKEIAENNRIQQEFNRTLAENKFNETKRHNAWSEGNQDRRTTYYVSGGGRGYGGGRRYGRGRSSGGGGKSDKPDKFSVDIPNKVTMGNKIYNFTSAASKDRYSEDFFDFLVGRDLISEADPRSSNKTKMEKVYDAAADDPRVRMWLNEFGITLRGPKGTFGRDGDNAGYHAPGKTPASSNAKSAAAKGGTGGRSQAVSAANNVYNSQGGKKNKIQWQSSGRDYPMLDRTSRAQTNGNEAGVSSVGGRHKNVTSYDKVGNLGTLVIPTEIYDPKTKRWKMKKTSDTLRDLYNALAKKGWVTGDARNEQEMVDDILDNINDDIADTLNILGIGYDDYMSDLTNWQ